jgi:hypothetical protein
MPHFPSDFLEFLWAGQIRPLNGTPRVFFRSYVDRTPLSDTPGTSICGRVPMRSYVQMLSNAWPGWHISSTPATSVGRTSSPQVGWQVFNPRLGTMEVLSRTPLANEFCPSAVPPEHMPPFPIGGPLGDSDK